MAQITPQATAYVTIQQPLASGNPFKREGGDWHAELCGCCDDTKECCMAYFCWCCFLGSLADSISESKWSCLCVPGALGMYRTKVRTTLNIKGSVCNDYCVTSCCGFCAAVQMRNELKYHGIS
ncbi:unnamed protein product [Adineta ricciae]|uniref:Uncharacterized protein n=1 Tax=Adineta ricciae TaxID=249248 RepID=A0A814C8J8_ADIRI|nr:unnamed protein product [Adineta ricciae]